MLRLSVPSRFGSLRSTQSFALVLLTILLPGWALAQAPAACCARPAATQVFASLGTDPAFTAAPGHAAPAPYHYTGVGEDITFPVTVGRVPGKGFLIRSAQKNSTRWLIVVHEWWGLNDYIKREAARFAEELPGVNVLAVDLYDGQLATDAKKASMLMQQVKPARAAAIIKGATAYAGPKARVASVGWCFGGGWSMQAALLNGKQAAGCVLYYGMPETDPANLQPLQTEVLAFFAGQDTWITPQIVQEFQQAMTKSGKKLTVKTYDADHAFANPSNPHYNKRFADEAHATAVTFLKRTLKK